MSAAAPATVTMQNAVVQMLNQYKPVMGKLLARHGISEETFIAQVANAMRAQPKLWDCDPPTVLGAALRAAQVGLAPNDGTNACWILPYGRSAAFQLGYGGVLELARRASPGVLFSGAVVYPNDIFEFEQEPLRLRHVPYYSRRGQVRESRGGPARLWYVKVSWPDGREHVHVLDREQVEYHRSFSKQPEGDAWRRSYDSMALKSAVLDLRRWLPTSPALAVAVGADDTVVDIRELEAAEPPSGSTALAADVDDRDLEDSQWIDDAKGDG